MTLIKSISGIRGTIGGKSGEGLTPLDTVKFTAAYGTWLQRATGKVKLKVVVGRDARISGAMVNSIVCATLSALGIDVLDIGLASTPTVEMAVCFAAADGGIILTASHNPKQWNALKLLNSKGEFLDATDGEELLKIVDNEDFCFAEVDKLGSIETDNDFTQQHIDAILELPLVDKNAIEKANFRVAIDCVNSVGGIAIPQLLRTLGVKIIDELYCTPDGNFPHNPEPLPENLKDISELVVAQKADVGFVVDPDVDRLAIINEDGSMFGEEYTLVAVADYILQNTGGNTVSNMSSTRALRDVTENKGYNYSASAVGEVNVVKQMKATNAIIGGEGNGGVIFPELHYGRDALVGIALFLSYLAKTGKTCSNLRSQYPAYFISKNKIQLTPDINVDLILKKMYEKYAHYEVSNIDGVKINFEKQWVHLRKSNTEPIIRIYAESSTPENAEMLAEKIISEIKSIVAI